MDSKHANKVGVEIGTAAPRQDRGVRTHAVRILVAISCGGALGALARYGLSTAFPAAPGEFPWATLGVNVSGCVLIGALMASIDDSTPGQRLLRAFLGVGILGGFTTFSTYSTDFQQAVAAGAARVALGYLGLTLVLALLGVFAGSVLTQGLARLVRRVRGNAPDEKGRDDS